jgi:hypothetical protein
LDLFAFEKAFQEVPIILPSAILAVVARRRLMQSALLSVWKHSMGSTHTRLHPVAQKRRFAQLNRVCNAGVYV